jgi:two-component system NtrC family response regulator
MVKVCRTVEKVAPSNASILFWATAVPASGTLRRSLHNLSPRASNRFIAINCAAIPENLEMNSFDTKKGPLPAPSANPGKIEYANSGTLFLDEVGDLPTSLQAKLLRFLQERVVERVGGREEIPVDVRVVCATHQDLQEKIRIGTFREDLYYRINVISVQIPALKERKGDSPVGGCSWTLYRMAGNCGFSKDTGSDGESVGVMCGTHESRQRHNGGGQAGHR